MADASPLLVAKNDAAAPATTPCVLGLAVRAQAASSDVLAAADVQAEVVPVVH